MRVVFLRKVVAVVSVVAASQEARAEGGLRKGPWLMDMRANAVVVMAEREIPGTLHVSARPVDADAGSPTIEANGGVSERLHEIGLSGLAAGTRYRYEVSGEGITPVSGTFSTPPAQAAPFRFVIYGDTRSDPVAHASVVQAVRREGADFVVHTGDLVADGRDANDWQDFFDIEAPLLRDVVFVPVIGNHEYVRPMSSGIENYRRYVHFEPDGPSPELDAVFRFANARFVLTSSYDDWTGPSRDWLQQQLEKARREEPDGWLFVVMHEGPRSSGPHGDSEHLRDAGVDRLLRRMRVDLVISGHDHAYERGDDDGIRYMVSGGGGAPLYPRRAVRSHTKRFASQHHHVRVDVERDKVSFTAVRPDGTTIDNAVLRHRGWDDMQPQQAPSPPTHAPRQEVTPTGPWVDWSTLVKFAPLLVLVSLAAWWARRRAAR